MTSEPFPFFVSIQVQQFASKLMVLQDVLAAVVSAAAASFQLLAAEPVAIQGSQAELLLAVSASVAVVV